MQQQQQRWWQHGLPTDGRAEGEPQLISLRDTAMKENAKVCALLAAVEAAQPEQPGSGSSSSIAEGFYGAAASAAGVPVVAG